MRAKTAKEVQSDVIKLLRGSALAESVSGKIYRSGQRPRDSQAEDIIVNHTAGIPGQEQTGVVTINIYVNNYDPIWTGQMIEDTERTTELEMAAGEWFDELNILPSHPYTFELQQSITTIADKDTETHIVVIKMKYTNFNIK